jgi:hypothetical protein
MDDDGNSEYIFNTFCTKLHLISLQMNSTQLDLNSVELKLNLNFNSIQIACNGMQYFHSNGTKFSQNQLFFFFRYFIIFDGV